MLSLRPRAVSSARKIVPLLLLVGTPLSAQFEERAEALGLTHECVPGVDSMTGPPPTNYVVLDWVQQGVALGDIDGDGDPDVLALGGLGRNTLFRNDGGSFVDITAASGIDGHEFDRIGAFGDYDGDGDLDLFVGALEGGDLGAVEGRGRLYRNDGSGVFEDVTCLSGTVGRGHSLCAKWHDLDRDGLLDLYVGEFLLTPNAYYRNNGDGTFTELAQELGIDDAGSAHTVAIFDSDDNGDPDLFIGNDFDIAKVIDIPIEQNQGNTSYHGQGHGVFIDSSADSGYDVQRAPMGSTVGDVNYDGAGDIYQSDLGRNPLFVNQGWPVTTNKWVPSDPKYGISNSLVLAPGGVVPKITSGWGVVFFHADADPWIDVFVVNGQVAGVQPFTAVMEREQQNFLFLSDGPPEFHFTDVSAAYGVDDHIDDRGLAAADMDGDLDVDFFITPTGGELRYYENQFDPVGANWVKVFVETHTSAPGGSGARVSWVDVLGFPHVRWMGSDSPTASQNANELVFALGAEATADFTIELPSGITLTYPAVPANSTLTAVEPELLQLSTRKLPIPSIATAGDPTDVTVTVFAHDATGMPLDNTAVVTIEAPGLTPTGPVANIAGNQFERTFLPAAVAGDHRVDVTIDGWTVGIRPRIHCTGLPDMLKSIVSVQPEAVRAGSTDPFVVCFTPRDANGLAYGPGHDVEIQIAGTVFPGPAIDLGDGRYTSTFEAAASAGVRSVQVVLDGFAAPGAGVMEFGGAADAGQTTVEAFVPLPAQSGSPNQMKFLVTPRDVNGTRLGSLSNVVLSLQPPPSPRRSGFQRMLSAVLKAPMSAGVLTGPGPSLLMRSEFADRGRVDGSYLFVMEKSADLQDLPTGMLYLSVDGQFLKSVPFDWDPTN